jgi:hypothetical protein
MDQTEFLKLDRVLFTKKVKPLQTIKSVTSLKLEKFKNSLKGDSVHVNNYTKGNKFARQIGRQQ